MSVENKITSVIREHRSGMPIGITSVCSANEYVIKAAVLNAKEHDRMVLIESTSNQVDQFGGYTGMTPDDFRKLVVETAGAVNFPAGNIVLGGDHLGPNVWQSESSSRAMENAREQVRAYVNAGYSKLHLDTSMKCADDVDTDEFVWPSVMAERVAALARVAEEEKRKRSKEAERLVYVIGTDVPPPGGGNGGSHSMRITTAEEVEETISLTRRSFITQGIEEAWDRVIALVAQPGVEFADEYIWDYDRDKARGLKERIEAEGHLVFEAHSTDFQLKESLRQMVEDHFAILKVGPWLTFAFREALFALESIERNLFGRRKSAGLSDLTKVIEGRMKLTPRYWEKYYQGDDDENLSLKRRYSLSDRIRYYWSDIEVKASLERLLRNLSAVEIPLALISQFLPESFEPTRTGETKKTAEGLIINRILTVLDKYNYATAGGNR